MEKNYRKIWDDEKFFISDDGYLFEENNNFVGGKREAAYRLLMPNIFNRFWEVYVLFTRNFMAYVIVGLHQGKRVVYDQDISRMTRGVLYLPIGRYLANTLFDENRWNIQTVRDGKLVDVTDEFTEEPHSFTAITHLSYTSPVLDLTVQQCQFHVERRFWLLDSKGCRVIEENEVAPLLEMYGNTEDDPLYR